MYKYTTQITITKHKQAGTPIRMLNTNTMHRHQEKYKVNIKYKHKNKAQTRNKKSTMRKHKVKIETTNTKQTYKAKTQQTRHCTHAWLSVRKIFSWGNSEFIQEARPVDANMCAPCHPQDSNDK